ncbi:hypothetical protein NDU88_003041 [Pleurodeles waltl]|uniref:Uncharacterized protein n=1 Tax=Pleurodeles waltl TaxID=8319 RepID=A0AAV7MCS8_PLEWA|nr:hypothetical protein NDU88_003041 [Pleurodeles waltl]
MDGAERLGAARSLPVSQRRPEPPELYPCPKESFLVRDDARIGDAAGNKDKDSDPLLVPARPSPQHSETQRR